MEGVQGTIAPTSLVLGVGVMKQVMFFDRYRICTNGNGAPEQAGRSGAAINYHGVDIRTDQSITLQLIPLAAIDKSKRRRFGERASAVKKLCHENLAQVFAAGVQHDYFAF